MVSPLTLTVGLTKPCRAEIHTKTLVGFLHNQESDCKNSFTIMITEIRTATFTQIKVLLTINKAENEKSDGTSVRRTSAHSGSLREPG